MSQMVKRVVYRNELSPTLYFGVSRIVVIDHRVYQLVLAVDELATTQFMQTLGLSTLPQSCATLRELLNQRTEGKGAARRPWTRFNQRTII